jgi:hypothetical protein
MSTSIALQSERKVRQQRAQFIRSVGHQSLLDRISLAIRVANRIEFV